MFKGKLIKYILLSIVFIGLFGFHSTEAQEDPSKPKVVGVCGPADDLYTFAEENWKGPFCSKGTVNRAPLSVPEPGSFADWRCKGPDDTGDGAYCRADREGFEAPEIDTDSGFLQNVKDIAQTILINVEHFMKGVAGFVGF